ncbi:MAG: hypothetical protein GXO02_00220, partial [Epsilonproteobacteria bacterium]|nr:hypothetical protein [Campylobacterota bacterium]
MKRGVLLTILTVALFSKENIEAKSKEDIASFNLKNLDSKFLVCKIGANQSPVDLNRFIKAELPKPKVIYSSHVT